MIFVTVIVLNVSSTVSGHSIVLEMNDTYDPASGPVLRQQITCLFLFFFFSQLLE